MIRFLLTTLRCCGISRRSHQVMRCCLLPALKSLFLFQPQNIVLMSEFPNCEIKLCDLEVSRVIQDSEQIREIIGTPDYVGETITFLNYRAITLYTPVCASVVFPPAFVKYFVKSLAASAPIYRF